MDLHELMLQAAQRCAETLEGGEEQHPSAEEAPLSLVSTGGLLASTAPNLAARSQKWLEKRSEHIASTRKQLDEARRDVESKDLVFSPKINPSHKLPEHLKDRSVLDRQADWNKAREEKMARLFLEAQRKEEEECTFHPTISDTSRAHPGRLPREVREALHSPLPPRGMILPHQPGEPLASLARRGADETHFLERMRKAKAKREEEASVKENKVSLREGGGGGGVWVPSSKRGGVAAAAGSKEGRMLHLSTPPSPPTATSIRSTQKHQQQQHLHNHGVTVRAGAVEMVGARGGGRGHHPNPSSSSPSGGSKGGGLSPFSKATFLLGALGDGSPSSTASLPPLPPPELRPQKGDTAVAGTSKGSQQGVGVFAMGSSGGGTSSGSSFEGLQQQGVKPRDLYTALFVEGGGRGGEVQGQNNSMQPPPSTDKWVMKGDQGGRVFARA